jgi:hypothetical protein
MNGQARILENQSPAIGVEFPADLLIETPLRRPAAVYLAMSEQRVLEAVVAQMAVTYDTSQPFGPLVSFHCQWSGSHGRTG